jgi:hypothetical protein
MTLRHLAKAAALAALCTTLLGCANPRIQAYANQVESRFMGAPAAEALKALGPPAREQRVADLRSYYWETGRVGEPGGNCQLRLVADPRGMVVDYTLDGTPLGCQRIFDRS